MGTAGEAFKFNKTQPYDLWWWNELVKDAETSNDLVSKEVRSLVTEESRRNIERLTNQYCDNAGVSNKIFSRLSASGSMEKSVHAVVAAESVETESCGAYTLPLSSAGTISRSTGTEGSTSLIRTWTSSLEAATEANVDRVWLQLPSGKKSRVVEWSTEPDRGGGILAAKRSNLSKRDKGLGRQPQ
jgi:hypothetical protein